MYEQLHKQFHQNCITYYKIEFSRAFTSSMPMCDGGVVEQSISQSCISYLTPHPNQPSASSQSHSASYTHDQEL